MTKNHSKVGLRFGKLIVLERIRRGKKVHWRCQCDCGKETIAEDCNLVYGRKKSCGCMRRTNIIIGTRFGMLVALEELKEERGRHYAILWRCRCDCGGEITCIASRLTSGQKKSCGCLKTRRVTFEEKMERHIQVTPEGCWIWGGDKSRYGITNKEGKNLTAHRAVWEHFNGPIPEGMHVCHNCPGGDNPGCCNPEHLWLGTNFDNHQDAVEKGRIHFGVHHPNSKLDDDKAREIFRRCHVDGETQASIARYFSIHVVTVSMVVWRKTWRKATEELARELGIP